MRPMGGYSIHNTIPKDQDFLAVDEFVKVQKPELREALILSVGTQVVSGMNYKIVYQKVNGDEVEVVVYNQPWTKTTRILRSTNL